MSIDLIGRLPAAERRADSPIDRAIRVDLAGTGADFRPAIIMTAAARVTWSLQIPAHAMLRTAVLLVGSAPGHGVGARIGMIDAEGRTYESLGKYPATTAAAAADWHSIDIDLGAYGGWQWSLFYRPSGRTWRLVFAADASPAGTIAWARPTIGSDE